MNMQRIGDGMHPHPVTMKIMAIMSCAALLVALGAQAAEPGMKAPKRAAKPPVADTVIEYAPLVNVTVGKSTLLKLPAPAARISVANPAVADIRLINPREVYLLGKAVGSTNLTLWSKSGRSTLVDVSVGADIAGLQSRLKEILPNEKDIRVHSAQETLVLTGTVQDVDSMTKSVALAEAYAGKKVLNFLEARQPEMMLEGKAVEQKRMEEGMLSAKVASKLREMLPDEDISVSAAADSVVLHGTVADAVKAQKAVALAEAYSSKEKVINFLSVGGAQQVMLEVKVAEISKTLIDRLGLKFQGVWTPGSVKFSLLSNFLFGNLGGTLSAKDGAGKGIDLDAEKKDGLIRILAEPNIMAISGQEGEFHAGGKIFIPVPQSGAGGGLSNVITLEERDFGVRLKFLPTVLEDGRINLRVRPEVSELSKEGTTVAATSGGSVSSTTLPTFTIRSASTTVQLRDGQSFAIGGLIKNNVTETVKRFPILGEIPILGALFRSSEFQTDRSELLFVITPRLVKPLPPDYALPTDSFVEPTRGEFFLEGRMEGKAARPQESAQSPTAPQGGEDAGFEMK